MANYRGHTLSADAELLISLYDALHNIIDEDSALSSIKKSAEEQTDNLKLFANELPKVTIIDNFTDYNAAINNVKEKVEEAIATIKSITSAIADYSDGVWDNIDNQKFLDSFLNQYNHPSVPNDNPGQDQSPLSPVKDETETNEDLNNITSLETETSTILDDTISPNTTSNQFLIPSIAASKALAETNNLNKDSDILDSKNVSKESLASKFFQTNSSLTVPNISTIGEVDDIKKSSIISAAGIALAAVALGGKVLYDKTHENEKDEEQREEIGEQSEELKNKQGEFASSDLNQDLEDNNIFDESSVNFKNQLLESGEVN
ncbi:MAG: hypothetical protein PUC82_00085 [bacterium]|nr:hypothetical protein [bacterium]